MKYRAVIFDLFGTLAESPSLLEYEGVLTRMAAVLRVPPDEFRRLWLETIYERETGHLATPEANIEHICQCLGRSVEASLSTAAAHIAVDFGRQMLVIRTDTVVTLSSLRKAGYKTGVISDTAWEIPDLWRGTHVASLVDVSIFSCEVGSKKPAPAIYELACQRLSVCPSECIYVGDGGSNELSGASQVGMHAVQLLVPNEVVDEAFRHGAEKWKGPVVKSLTEVLGLMR